MWDSQKQEKEQLAVSSHGTLFTDSKNIVYPRVCLGSICHESGPEGFYPLVFGDGCMCIIAEGSLDNNLSGDRIFVCAENGKLKLTATVRDETGKIMGDIINNRFESYPQYALKARHDDYGWEVIDPYGRVAFQVDLDRGCAYIKGIFYSMNGDMALVSANDRCINFGPGLPSNEIKKNVDRYFERTPNLITPIFDYSSDEYPSKRITGG